jgi:hypothetical protein
MGYLKETASCFSDMKFVALVSIVDCVVVELLLLIKMVCSDCDSVVLCAFTLGLRGDVVVGSICSSARKAPALEAWSQACCLVLLVL